MTDALERAQGKRKLHFMKVTFHIDRKHDEKAHGEYRTKRVILEIYYALADSTLTGTPYQTRLTPLPASPSCCHQTKSFYAL
jgi:hypothetical protein